MINVLFGSGYYYLLLPVIIKFYLYSFFKATAATRLWSDSINSHVRDGIAMAFDWL